MIFKEILKMLKRSTKSLNIISEKGFESIMLTSLHVEFTNYENIPAAIYMTQRETWNSIFLLTVFLLKNIFSDTINLLKVEKDNE